MEFQLSEGAIEMLATGKLQPKDVIPVLQVYDLRVVPSQTSSNGEKQERYRLLLSDGSFFTQGMLATQQNELVRSQQMQKGSIVRLKEFVCNWIRERAILIIIDLDVMVNTCEIIGYPQQCPFKSGSEPPSPIQPFNQPSTTNVSPQTFMSTSVPRPANSPIYPPQQTHNTPSHTYGNPISNPSVPSVSRTPTTNSYTRPVQPTYNPQPPPMYTNRGPTAKNEAPPRVIPIAALNPYQGKWTIKARVTAKAELRRYNNAKGDGKVFSFDLLDSDGGEIRVTCFNAVADQFYDQVEVGKIYFISKGTVKAASKAFNHLKNDHEILLDNSSTIQTCLEDDSSIPRQQFHFRPIADIEGMENYSVLDVIGIVSSITPTATVITKKNTEAQKRTLQLKDMSGRSVEVTLWGNFCSAEGQTLQSMCDNGVFPVVAIKSAKVSDFNGKSIGTISTSQLLIDPDFPEGRKLKTWFENIGRVTPSVSLSNTIARTDVRKTISQIRDEKLGTSEKPDWITVSATIWQIRLENLWYTACPIMIGDRQCNKKVTNNGDGKWRCDRCDQSVDECDFRYILSFNIQDHTGSIWVTAFQESGEEILGVSAKDLHNMKMDEGDEESFAGTIRNVLYSRFNFKLKVKEESYQDEARVKSTVVKAEKIKASSDTGFYLGLLKKEENPGFVAAPKVEIPIPANAGIRDSVPFPNYMGSGSVSGVGQQVSQTGGQYGNQYGGLGSRVGSSSCNSCGGVGHNSANCPSGYTQGGGRDVPPAYGGGNTGGGGGGVTGECHNCHKSGHWARDCPSPRVSNATSAYGGGSGGGGGGGTSGECYNCHKSGHWARDCPTPRGGGGGGGNVGPGRYGSAYVGGY